MKIIKNVLPKEDNIKIIKHLIRSPNWIMAYDIKRNDEETILEQGNVSIKINKLFDLETLHNNFLNFQGMSMTTYNIEASIDNDPYLNDYAHKITEIVCKKAKIKKYKIFRFFWNFYRPSDATEWHLDRDSSGFMSFVYNLHDSDGGTEISKKIYYDKEGEAKLFKSDTKHRGLGPKKLSVRLNLNCVLQLK